MKFTRIVWNIVAALAYRRAKSPEANIGNAEEATDEAK